MLTAIPNQPINFGEDPILTLCQDDPIPLRMRNTDTLIFQFMQQHCPNAGTFVVSETFASGWLTGGDWDTRGHACAEAGQQGASIQNDDFTPNVGELYELQFSIDTIAGSGVVVSMGGASWEIMTPGAQSFTFIASDTDPLVFELVDDTSAVCIAWAQVWQGNSGITVRLVDLNDGDDIYSFNITDNPELFTLSGQHVTFILPLVDLASFEHNSVTCFRVRVEDDCAYLDPSQDHYLCSGPIQVETTCERTILMRVCNDSDQMGFVSGRFEVRLPAQLVRPSWTYPDNEEEVWADGFINRPFITRQVVYDLSIEPVDGMLHPFLSALPLFDHVYIGTTEFVVEVEDHEPGYDDVTVSAGGIVLRLKPQMGLLTKARCAPIGEGCNPANDPICTLPQAIITTDYDGAGDFYVDVVLYGLQGFVPNQLLVTVDGYAQTPIPFSTPQSQHLGPYVPGSVVEITITNRDVPDCNYTHPPIEVPMCDGPGFGHFTTGYEGDIRIRVNTSDAGANGYGTVRDPLGNDFTFVKGSFYNLSSADDSVKEFCVWHSNSAGGWRNNLQTLSFDSPGYNITDIDVSQLAALTELAAQNNDLVTVDLSGNALLANVDLSGNNLSGINMPPAGGNLALIDLQDNSFTTPPDFTGRTNNGIFIFMQNNLLGAAAMDQMIIDIESNGTSGGFLFADGTNAAPTGASLAARTALSGRGWTLITN